MTCYDVGLVWSAKQARRERIEQQAINDYCHAAHEVTLSSYTNCKVQGPVVGPTPNVTLESTEALIDQIIDMVAPAAIMPNVLGSNAKPAASKEEQPKANPFMENQRGW